MIELLENDPWEHAGDMLVCLVPELSDDAAACANERLEKALQPARDAGDFKGKAAQTFICYPAALGTDPEPLARVKRVLLVGLGKINENPSEQREQLRIAAGVAVAAAAKVKATDLALIAPDCFDLAPDITAESLAEGLLLADYRFDKYKSPPKNDNGEDEPLPRIERFFLQPNGLPAKQIQKGLERGRIAAKAACEARNMANEPGNGWTAEHFAEYARKLAVDTCLSYRVLEKADMRELGMGGIIGVNQGSTVPPKLVILEYITSEDNPTLMLVGKGLTFDSGGVSLKPGKGMQDMKFDMCGGAAVIATMQALAEERPEGINVVALVPATDNMMSGSAMKPGDIIKHYNGKTTEVVNTDAEGRLILADALAYGVEQFKPYAVIDLATLTGAVIVGLGHHRTGLLSNNDKLAEQVLAAGEMSGEPLWRLPMGKEYAKQLKSDVADLKNVGGPAAGTITAGCFLQEFVGDTPWVHLDIAGTAWGFTEKSYIPKGPSGIGVRTLVNLIREHKGL